MLSEDWNGQRLERFRFWTSKWQTDHQEQHKDDDDDGVDDDDDANDDDDKDDEDDNGDHDNDDHDKERRQKVRKEEEEEKPISRKELNPRLQDLEVTTLPLCHNSCPSKLKAKLITISLTRSQIRSNVMKPK